MSHVLRIEPVNVGGPHRVQVFRFQQVPSSAAVRPPQGPPSPSSAVAGIWKRADAEAPQASRSLAKSHHAGLDPRVKRALEVGAIAAADAGLVAAGWMLGRHEEHKRAMQMLAYPYGLSTRQGAVYARAAAARRY